MGGRFYQVEPWGDGLRLDSGRSATGVYCMAAVDSGENGFRWGRVAVEADLPPDTALRLYAYASDTRQWGEWADLDRGIQSLEGDPMPALGEIFGPPVAESGDGLIGRSGRYLWLMLELTAAGAGSPVVHALRLWMGGDHMVDYLPAIYQEQDFTCRYLSIFNTMFQDMEAAIDELPRLLDAGSAPPEMLEFLARWLCMEPERGEEHLRQRLPEILEEYESMYTPAGVGRSVERLTGRKPWIIEHFAVNPNDLTCCNPALYRRLYGEEPYRFFLLLPQGTFEKQQDMERFLERMRRLIPAETEMELVLLKPCIQLDWHTYLGINSQIGDYIPAAIDDSVTIHYDTTIGGA